MKRVEEHLATNRRRPVSRHTADDITRWFSELGRKKRLNEWQFRQCVEAVGMLMRVAGAPSLKEVDWEFWLAGGKALESAHPTTGRNNSPITVSEPPSFAVTAASGNDLLADFVRAIRIEGLAFDILPFLSLRCRLTTERKEIPRLSPSWFLLRCSSPQCLGIAGLTQTPQALIPECPSVLHQPSALANSAVPACRMLRAAFTSRSMPWVPQSGQSQVRTSSGSDSNTNPQP